MNREQKLEAALREIEDGLPNVRAPHRFSAARKIARAALAEPAAVEREGLPELADRRCGVKTRRVQQAGPEGSFHLRRWGGGPYYGPNAADRRKPAEEK